MHKRKSTGAFPGHTVFLLTEGRSQWPGCWWGGMKGRWWWPPHNWLWDSHHSPSSSCVLRTPYNNAHDSQRPGCTHTYQGTGTPLHQTSWSALCPMCCRWCRHGWKLGKILKHTKHFESQNVVYNKYWWQWNAWTWVLPSLAWTSVTLATEKAKKHNQVYLHLILTTLGLMPPKQIITWLNLTALYIETTHFSVSTLFMRGSSKVLWPRLSQHVLNRCSTPCKTNTIILTSYLLIEQFCLHFD